MRRVGGRSAVVLAFIVAVVSIVAVPSAVQAGGGGRGHDSHGSSSCGLYPIGVKARSLAGASPGKWFYDITTGRPSGHEGWLTWTGEVSEPVLRRA